jgi:DNA-binding LacI/PurR family transcriptional regulator
MKRVKPLSSVHVAKLAGVSRATVSAVLNGNKYVSPDLQDRVRQAIADLDYRPNAIARSLKINRTNTIGLIVPNISSPFWPPLARSIEQVLSAHGYHLVLVNAEEQGERASEAMDLFIRHRMDGVLVAAPSHSESRHYEPFVRTDRPLVFVDFVVPGVKADVVKMDSVVGGYLAAKHLVALGYRRLAMITMPLDMIPSADRLVGVRRALAEANITLPDDRLMAGPLSEQDGFAAAQHLIRQSPRPEALFVASLRATTGAFGGIRQAGFRIPDDIALVGYDETPWSSLVTPPLTVVFQPARALGRIAAEILLGRISGSLTGEPIVKVLQPKLIIRASCGTLRDGTFPYFAPVVETETDLPEQTIERGT